MSDLIVFLLLSSIRIRFAGNFSGFLFQCQSQRWGVRMEFVDSSRRSDSCGEKPWKRSSKVTTDKAYLMRLSADQCVRWWILAVAKVSPKCLLITDGQAIKLMGDDCKAHTICNLGANWWELVRKFWNSEICLRFIDFEELRHRWGRAVGRTGWTANGVDNS